MQVSELFEEAAGAKPVTVSWQPANAPGIARGDYTIVWVDIAKLDAAWQRDREHYIGPGGTGAIIGRRYPDFGKWLPTRVEEVKTPEVYIMPESAGPRRAGAVSFGNGRHRFSWLRDHGAKSLPVQVDVDQAGEFEQRFGTRLRRTVLRMPVTESRLDEVHWTDLYPKSFQAFRSKYLKLARAGKAHGLYVQFTNYANNAMDRTAHASPDHSDPVGVYGYPLAYVLSHPADIWYGKGARYLRVLQDASKQCLDLSYISSQSKAENLLNRMGFRPSEIDAMLSLATKHYRDRIKGTNRFAKLFLTAAQVDLISPPTGHTQPGMFNRGGPEFRIRSGAEQTALFRRAGIDAIADSGRTNKSAIINEREPEQIIFLNRAAFRVVEVVPLRPGVPDDQLPTMTHASPETPRIERPLAAALSRVLGDQLKQSARDPKVRAAAKLDAAYHYYWTVKGRRIEITFERPDSYYDGKKMGEKKHRESKLGDSFQTHIKIRTELGSISQIASSERPFSEIVQTIGQRWKELQAEPRPDGWKPEDASTFMAAIEAQRNAVIHAKMDKEKAERIAKLPDFLTSAQWVAEHYGMPFEPTGDDDIDQWVIQQMEHLSNLMSWRKSDMGEAVESMRAMIGRRGETRELPWMAPSRQALDLVERAWEDVRGHDKAWQVERAGEEMFQRIQNLLTKGDPMA